MLLYRVVHSLLCLLCLLSPRGGYHVCAGGGATTSTEYESTNDYPHRIRRTTATRTRTRTTSITNSHTVEHLNRHSYLKGAEQQLKQQQRNLQDTCMTVHMDCTLSSGSDSNSSSSTGSCQDLSDPYLLQCSSSTTVLSKLTFAYRGGNCSHTQNSQPCTSDCIDFMDQEDSQVQITCFDATTGTQVLFDDVVQLNSTFTLEGTIFAGEENNHDDYYLRKLPTHIMCAIGQADSRNLVQTIRVDTSSPLLLHDTFGSLRVESCLLNNHDLHRCEHTTVYNTTIENTQENQLILQKVNRTRIVTNHKDGSITSSRKDLLPSNATLSFGESVFVQETWTVDLCEDPTMTIHTWMNVESLFDPGNGFDPQDCRNTDDVEFTTIELPSITPPTPCTGEPTASPQTPPPSDSTNVPTTSVPGPTTLPPSIPDQRPTTPPPSDSTNVPTTSAPGPTTLPPSIPDQRPTTPPPSDSTNVPTTSAPGPTTLRPSIPDQRPTTPTPSPPPPLPSPTTPDPPQPTPSPPPTTPNLPEPSPPPPTEPTTPDPPQPEPSPSPPSPTIPDPPPEPTTPDPPQPEPSPSLPSPTTPDPPQPTPSPPSPTTPDLPEPSPPPPTEPTTPDPPQPEPSPSPPSPTILDPPTEPTTPDPPQPAPSLPPPSPSIPDPPQTPSSTASPTRRPFIPAVTTSPTIMDPLLPPLPGGKKIGKCRSGKRGKRSSDDYYDSDDYEACRKSKKGSGKKR